MNSLIEHFKNNTGRGIAKYEHYFPIYEQYFSKFVGKEMNFLEIGIGEGGSLQMWKEYFGPKSKLFGIDLNERNAIDDEQIKTFVVDQSKPEQLKNLVAEIPQLDVVIDDGGHGPNEQITSFEYLFGHLKEGGVYLIEDCNHNYAEKEGGGYKAFGSAIEYFKDHVDYLYGYFDTDRGELAREHSASMECVNFYDLVIVITKHNKAMTHKSPYRTGDWKYHADPNKRYE